MSGRDISQIVEPAPGEVQRIADCLPILSSSAAAERAADLLRWQQAEILLLQLEVERLLREQRR